MSTALRESLPSGVGAADRATDTVVPLLPVRRNGAEV